MDETYLTGPPDVLTIGEHGARRLNWASRVDYYQPALTLEQAAHLVHQNDNYRDWPWEHVLNFVGWMSGAQTPWVFDEGRQRILEKRRSL